MKMFGQKAKTERREDSKDFHVPDATTFVVGLDSAKGFCRSACTTWRLSCGCTKTLSHPEATICQYRQGHCVCAGLPIVVCVCLSWPSPLYQQGSTPREKTKLSVKSVSCLSPFSASDCTSADIDTECQSA